MTYFLPTIKRAADSPGGPGDSNPNATFIATLPEDLRANPEFKDFKGVGDLAKSYVERGKLVGMEKLALPKDDAAPADWDPVFKRLGRPEKAEGYKFGEVTLKHIKTEDQSTQKLVNDFRTNAHSLGLSQKQAD